MRFFENTVSAEENVCVVRQLFKTQGAQWVLKMLNANVDGPYFSNLDLDYLIAPPDWNPVSIMCTINMKPCLKGCP